MPRYAQPLRLAVALATASSLSASGRGAWELGIDVNIEGALGRNGAGDNGKAWHGMALLHATQGASTAAGWQRTFYVSALQIAGHGPTGRFLGDALTVSNFEGEPGLRLYAWWFEAARADWSLRAGVLLADEEFAGTETGGAFLNSAFGWPAFISANTRNTGPAFFVPAPGVRLERKWTPSVSWRIGLYDGDSLDSAAGDMHKVRHGLHYGLGGEQGVFLLSEIDIAPPDSSTRGKLGVWFHTADFADVRDDHAGQPFARTGNPPRHHSSNHGFYAAIEHLAGGVGFHLRAGGAPSDRNTITWAADAGVAWTGPLPSRPDDVLALGWAGAWFGSRFAESARLAAPGTAGPDFEQVIELTYTFRISDRVAMQPDFQYIRHPGGDPSLNEATAILLRISASL